MQRQVLPFWNVPSELTAWRAAGGSPTTGDSGVRPEERPSGKGQGPEVGTGWMARWRTF